MFSIPFYFRFFCSCLVFLNNSKHLLIIFDILIFAFYFLWRFSIFSFLRQIQKNMIQTETEYNQST